MRPLLVFPILSLVLLSIAGCRTGKPISMTVTARPTASNIQNGDVLAPQRRAGLDIPALHGTEIVTVRTYEHTKKKDGGFTTSVELENIDCALESDGFTASVKTPAEVRVPDYGYASRPISVRCNAPGYKTSYKNESAFNRTMEQRMSNAGSGGFAGVVVVALINAASDIKKHDFGYQPIGVTMNRIGCETAKVKCR